MSDLVRVYDENNNLIDGIYNRDDIPNNTFYYAVNVWIIFDDKTIMIQKRSNNKKLYPNKLECVAGGVLYNENVKQACVREVKEEIGIDIDIDQLEFLNLYKDIKHSYFMHTYYVVINKNNKNLISIDNNEVSDYYIVDQKQLINLINDNQFADSIKNRFELYIDKIKQLVD